MAKQKWRWIEAKGTPRSRRVERFPGCQSIEKGNTGKAICEWKWEPLPLPLDGERARKEWILFDDGAGLADRLAPLLGSRGDGCICVADTARLGDAIRSLGESCSGVICFPHENGADGRAAIKEAWRIAQIVRGLSTDAGGLRVPLWLVTSGAQQLPGDGTDVAAAQAVAWGMSGVIGAEFPAWSCSNVDCSFFPSSEELQAFVVLLHSDRVENRVAIRGGACFAARFARSAAKELTQAPRFRDAATYLITGGMGGVGLELAKWIVQSGGRHIALLGRRGPSEEVKKEIARLELQGATIRVLRADIADERQIKASLKTIAEEMPGLRGIFHLAAIMEGALLASMREEQLERVMLPKVAGAWALHRYTEDLPLDFFVFFSSITASLSQPGLSSYAAANAFLDALARYRKAKGLRALSLEWSPWLNVGLVNDQRVQVGMKEYAQQGIRGLHPEAALEVLQRALRQEEVVSYVFPADWEQFGRAFADGPMPRAFLNLVPGRAGEGREAAGGDSLRDRLLAAAPGRMRRSLLETHVQEILAKILKTDVAQIDSQKALGGMGVDSLMAVQVVRMLARTTSVQLPATSVFNYPTVRALSAELANRMGVSLQADGGLETRAAKSEVPATEKNTPAAKNTPAEFWCRDSRGSDRGGSASILDESGRGLVVRQAPEKTLSAAKLALTIRRLREERGDVALLGSEPIAIVGIGCRFPGGIRSAEDYWKLLHDGVDAISMTPPERWKAEEYFDPDPQSPGKTNTRWGGFVADVDAFDPMFFGIAPREAASMDPQQRLALEVAWEAIWDSGHPPESLSASNTGVFLAVCNSDYERLVFEDPAQLGSHSCSGTYQSVASGRISFLLNLQGPSISVDTACSSSLVAIHLACQSLRAGECSLALAGGVMLHLLPEHYVGLAKLGMLSPDGRCKTFDAKANGFVPSDGCGMVMLRPLADALQYGDSIYAVIRGTAVNQDGHTSVLTAPNGLAQQAVITAAIFAECAGFAFQRFLC